MGLTHRNVLLSSIVLTVFVVGCENPAGRAATLPKSNLVFYDQAGNVVAHAGLLLPAQLPPAGSRFEGQWQLEWSAASFPSGATRSGKYAGTVIGPEVSI